MDITEFIAARLDEDEATARSAALDAAKFAGRANWSAGLGTIITDAEDSDWAICDLSPVVDDECVARHIARHDPARVLREVAAKRAIMGLHDLPEHYCPLPVLPGRHGQLWTPEEGPCWTLRLLASTYSDHPDYAEWLP